VNLSQADLVACRKHLTGIRHMWRVHWFTSLDSELVTWGQFTLWRVHCKPKKPISASVPQLVSGWDYFTFSILYTVQFGELFCLLVAVCYNMTERGFVRART